MMNIRLLLLACLLITGLQGCATTNDPYLPPIVSGSDDGISPEAAAINNSEFVDDEPSTGTLAR